MTNFLKSFCYPTHVFLILLLQNNFYLLMLLKLTVHDNPSPRSGPEYCLVTHFDCEHNQQKTLHKNAINQVT